MAELRFERRGGRPVLVDPAEPPTADDVVVLTSGSPVRVRGALAAARAGVPLTVVAPAPLLAWLASQGTPDSWSTGDGGPPPRTVDGVQIDAMPYTPAPAARPLGHYLQASIRGARPGRALRRLAEQVRAPATEPHVLQLTFPDGSRLLHLDLALHRDTPETWVADAAARFGNAEWTVVGLPWGEAEAVARLLPRFGPNRVLVTELVNAERRELGLPTELVTPLRDRLVGQGIEAHVFATQASYRFE